MTKNIFAETTDEIMRENIRASWNRASEQCREQGRDWYPAAHRLAIDLADASSLAVGTVAAIIAVLSPRSAWGTNVKNTAAVLVETGHLTLDRAIAILFDHGYGRDPVVDTLKIGEGPRGLGGNIAKARAIASLVAHGFATTDEYVTGQKVRSFFGNIVDPTHSNDVTIDAWAAGVAIGRRLTTAEMSGLKARQYQRIADAYRAEAKKLHKRASVVQATTWCEMRGRER